MSVLIKNGNVLVIVNAQVQLNRVALPLAIPLALTGNISLIMSQAQGPHVIPNATMYTVTLVTATHEKS